MKKPIKRTKSYELYHTGGHNFIMWWRDKLKAIEIFEYSGELSFDPYPYYDDFPMNEIEKIINKFLSK